MDGSKTSTTILDYQAQAQAEEQEPEGPRIQGAPRRGLRYPPFSK